ncbi:MAG TPA: hypothetical protein VJQ07_05955, partial [Gaiellaceae bacterium]|nr:hypothetical protein [Gaiellaceae bacterium]
MKRTVAVVALLVVGALAAAPAFGSAIIGRDVSRPTLTIDRQGRAHVSYSLHGRTTKLLAWGAVNA